MCRILLTVVLALGCAAGSEKSSTSQVAAPGSPNAAAPLPKARGLLAALCGEPAYRAPKLEGLKPRKLAEQGFNFLEGALWWEGTSSLLFSDMQPASGPEGVQPSHVRSWSPSGELALLIENAGTNGLALGSDGKLYGCTHDTQSISAFDLGSKARSSVVERTAGKRFNSPNDLTLRSDGTIYFTDPNWQRGNRPSETGMTGVYRVTGGQVSLVDGTLKNPNGIALSPDETFLYVGAADDLVRRYAIEANGAAGPAQEFARVSGPDGMTVDCAGNLYVTSHGGGKAHVLAPDGHELGSIEFASSLTNLAFGGTDHRTLFATTAKALYAVELDIAGAPY